MSLALSRRGFLAISIATGAAAGHGAIAGQALAPTALPPAYTPLSRIAAAPMPTPLCFVPSGARPVAARQRLRLELGAGRPVQLGAAELARLPQSAGDYVLALAENGAAAPGEGCDRSHGRLHAARWQGVALADLPGLAAATATPGTMLEASGADGRVLLPLEKALDDALVATAMNGAPLGDWHGGAMRLVLPGWDGGLWLRGLERLALVPAGAGQPTQAVKLTDDLHPSRGGRWSPLIEVGSVITSPAPDRRMARDGAGARLEGFAWTGRGRVSRVDVSLDGGASWQAAELDPAPNPKAAQRFRLRFAWDGRPFVAASRATDSAGATQPARGAVQLASAETAGRHVNAIQWWRIGAAGMVVL